MEYVTAKPTSGPLFRRNFIVVTTGSTTSHGGTSYDKGSLRWDTWNG